MTAQAILDEIRPLGSDGYKKILLRHGAVEPIYGVKIDALKEIQKRVKVNVTPLFGTLIARNPNALDPDEEGQWYAPDEKGVAGQPARADEHVD